MIPKHQMSEEDIKLQYITPALISKWDKRKIRMEYQGNGWQNHNGYLSGSSVGAIMNNLNHKMLSSIPFPLPPLAEQKRIIAKLEEILPLCERLK